MKLSSFVDPGRHHFIISLCELLPRSREEYFLRITSIFTQNLPPHYGGSSYNLQFLVSLPDRCYKQNLI